MTIHTCEHKHMEQILVHAPKQQVNNELTFIRIINI
jgi:hypothetical protein